MKILKRFIIFLDIHVDWAAMTPLTRRPETKHLVGRVQLARIGGYFSPKGI